MARYEQRARDVFRAAEHLRRSLRPSRLPTAYRLLPTGVGYAGSAAAVVAASLVAEAARHLLGIVNISLIYLIVVVAVATLWGLWPALVASLLAATALALLFVPLFGTLTVAPPGDRLSMYFIMVLVVIPDG